ncbi:MAG TPA: PLP-dependent transferase [Thermoanaerobaculia bacterium]|nr:PLP-dependent transferase [Thermoanaerobaculia bacterium]
MTNIELREKPGVRRALPCGTRLPPTSLHAVSVSLPKLEDLVAYEEQRPEMLARVPSGYPRFHIHPFVTRLRLHAGEALGLGARDSAVVASERAARGVCAYAGLGAEVVHSFRDVWIVALPDDPDAAQRARSYVQHTGSGISSRRAEDLLVAEGVLEGRQQEEEIESGDGAAVVRGVLAEAYGATPGHVHLGNFGMSAMNAVYRAVTAMFAPSDRKEWVQFGWLFMDTIETLRKFPPEGAPSHAIHSPLMLGELEALLEARPGRIAGVVTETPSNPLLQTGDIARLRELCDRHGCALIIDATLGTPYNVDVLPYADAVVESLTKYASGSADLMLGAVIVNPAGGHAAALQELVARELDAPYWRDAARLAWRIRGYAARMERVNANTMALAELFASRPSVKRVRWAYQTESRRNYERIHRRPASPGGLITLELHMPLEAVYDRLELPKGPSLGAEFTLVGPYLYHAHYSLVRSAEGRSYLASKGLDPNLLRVSAGIEETSELIDAFAAVL